MFNLSSEPGSIGYGSTSWETGNPSTSVEGRDNYQELIRKANTVPLSIIFKYYNVRLDEHNRSICPFKSHKGGRERTASFNYYPDTNSYNCFGCDQGGAPIHFIMQMDNCSKQQSLKKIIQLFELDFDDDGVVYSNNIGDRLEIMLDFSNSVRDLINQFKSEEAFNYVEAACKKYDELNLKHNLDNEALKKSIEKLKQYLSLFNK